jgi:hypothetical protein
VATLLIIISFNASQAASLARKKTAFDSSISKEDRKIFAAARSCPVTKVQQISFTTGKSFQVEVHRCDEDFSERFLKSLQGYSQTEFVLVFETGFKNPPLLAGFMSILRFEQFARIEIQGKSFLLLETAREGSGEYSEWCLMGLVPGENRIACLEKPDEEEFSKPYIKRDEGTKAFYPSFRNGQLTVSAPVEHDGDANCCPSRGKIALTFEVKGAALKVTKVGRLSAATNDLNSKPRLN